ncbi:LOW QUALITY PROTEIN: hypothetical protein HID58_085527, partial [Brassica napus]
RRSRHTRGHVGEKFVGSGGGGGGGGVCIDCFAVMHLRLFEKRNGSKTITWMIDIFTFKMQYQTPIEAVHCMNFWEKTDEDGIVPPPTKDTYASILRNKEGFKSKKNNSLWKMWSYWTQTRKIVLTLVLRFSVHPRRRRLSSEKDHLNPCQA